MLGLAILDRETGAPHMEASRPNVALGISGDGYRLQGSLRTAAPYQRGAAGLGKEVTCAPAASRMALGMLIALAMVVAVPSANAQIVYVDAGASGANDGSTWPDAFKILQDALATAGVRNSDGNAANDVTEIWVAAGIYRPADRTCRVDADCDGPGGGVCAAAAPACVWLSPREQTFQLLNGVALYGGFAGGETDRSERDIAANLTVLSGDLSGNDSPIACNQDSPDCDSFGSLCIDGSCIVQANNAENSYHVVTGSGTDPMAVIDGFTLTAGNANGPFGPGHDRGGGMLNVSGNPTVANCELRGNWGNSGGGVFNDLGSPAVCHCTFRRNAAQEAGGMYNFIGSNPVVTGCTFAENSAAYSGAGMRNVTSNPAVIGCVFTRNAATGPAASAGAIGNVSGSHPMLTDCTFDSNSADAGGGVLNDSGSSPTVIRCAFNGDSAVIGGGMLNGNSSNPAVSDCLFSGNLADFGGGGMANRHNADPTVSGCTFTANSTSGNGGGIYNQNNSNPIVRKCVFGGNTAADNGGAMYNTTSSPTISHCAFWGNSAHDGGGVFNSESNPLVSNCAFGGNAALFGGGMYNHVDSNPEVANCAFSGNTADTNGGAMAVANSTPILANCILWKNVDDADGDLGGPFMDESAQIHNFSGKPVTVNYSIVQGGWTGAGGVGVLDEDPLFVDPNGADGVPGTLDDDLRLAPGSPGINAGSNDAIPADVADLDGDGDTAEPSPVDLDGHARILCGTVDMGAYEFGAGDFNCDRVIDLADFADWPACMTGPAGPAEPYLQGCEAFDIRYNARVDLRDFAALTNVITGQ